MNNPNMLKTALCSVMTFSCLAVIAPKSMADTCLTPQGPRQFNRISEDCKPKATPQQDSSATKIAPQDQAGQTDPDKDSEPIGGAQLDPEPEAKKTFPTLERRGPRNSFHIVD